MRVRERGEGEVKIERGVERAGRGRLKRIIQNIGERAGECLNLCVRVCVCARTCTCVCVCVFACVCGVMKNAESWVVYLGHGVCLCRGALCNQGGTRPVSGGVSNINFLCLPPHPGVKNGGPSFAMSRPRSGQSPGGV